MTELNISDFVIWQDDAILVINKPAGLLTIPDGYDQSQPYLGKLLEARFGKCWTVHRLDRETSGVLIIARSAKTHHFLNDQFASRKVRKAYHALISGTPAWEQITIDNPLRKNGDRHHRTIVDENFGKPALTICQVIERFTGYCLIEVHPHTGYTHQIRSHLANIGYPLMGDSLYGGLGFPVEANQMAGLLSRVSLHAFSIRFAHPTLDKEMYFQAPYPQDFANTVDWLRNRKTSKS